MDYQRQIKELKESIEGIRNARTDGLNGCSSRRGRKRRKTAIQKILIRDADPNLLRILSHLFSAEMELGEFDFNSKFESIINMGVVDRIIQKVSSERMSYQAKGILKTLFLNKRTALRRAEKMNRDPEYNKEIIWKQRTRNLRDARLKYVETLYSFNNSLQSKSGISMETKRISINVMERLSEDQVKELVEFIEIHSDVEDDEIEDKDGNTFPCLTHRSPSWRPDWLSRMVSSILLILFTYLIVICIQRLCTR